MIPANRNPWGKHAEIGRVLYGVESLDSLSVVVDPDLDKLAGGDVVVCGWRDGQVVYTHTIERTLP